MKNIKIIKGLAVLFLAVAIVLITAGVTYAFFSQTSVGDKTHSIATEGLIFRYDEESQGISLQDAMPMSDEVGMTQKKYFDFTITAKSSPKVNIPYAITVRVSKNSTLPSKCVNTYLTDQEDNEIDDLGIRKIGDSFRQIGLPQYTGVDYAVNYEERVIYNGVVPKESSDYMQKFRLRMWIDENADKILAFDHESTDVLYNGGTFSVTVNVYAKGNDKAYTALGELDTIGTVVKIANEEFYVIGKEGNKIKLLSKYNLDVGNVVTEELDENGEFVDQIVTPIENPTGLQNPLAFGMSSGTNAAYGTVGFAKGKYWDDPEENEFARVYVYTNDKENGEYKASIAEYVDNYVDYLNHQGVSVSGRLLSVDEFYEISNQPFAMATSYWTGDTSSTFIYYVYKDFRLDNHISHTYLDTGLGVRPVILLEP